MPSLWSLSISVYQALKIKMSLALKELAMHFVFDCREEKLNGLNSINRPKCFPFLPLHPLHHGLNGGNHGDTGLFPYWLSR